MGAARWKRTLRPAGGALAVAAASRSSRPLLRFYGIGHQGFWFDEANTAQLVHFSPGKMLGLIPQTESTPPLYYCVAWVWARVFGYGEAGLRSLSAVAGRAHRAGRLRPRRAADHPPRRTDRRRADRLQPAADLVLAGGALLLAARAADGAVAAGVRLRPRDARRPRISPRGCWPRRWRWPPTTTPRWSSCPRRCGCWPCTGGPARSRSRSAVVVACGLALIPLAISQNATGNASWIARSRWARGWARSSPSS